MECVLGDLLTNTHMCSCLCFEGIDVEIGRFASVHRRESFNHTSIILGERSDIDLFKLITVFHSVR